MITLDEKRGAKKDTTRDYDMCCLFRGGETLAEIGTHYDVTRERVRQILKRYGLTRKDGGASVQNNKIKIEQAAILKIKHDKRAIKYGVSWEEYQVLRKRIGADNARRFQSMRAHVLAGNGGYKKNTWEISLRDFVDVWDAAGCEVNQKGYCFARIDYTKGFTMDNLHIITSFDFGQRAGTDFGFVAHPENIIINHPEPVSIFKL